MATDRTSLVLLDEASSEQAKIKMRDGDTFFVAIADAARACKAYDNAKEFGTQFSDLIASLEQWIEVNKSRIRSAYLTIRENDILFLVMQKSSEFDDELATALTDLDLSIANSHDLGLVNLNVMAIPAVSQDAVGAFLSSGTTHAKHAGTLGGSQAESSDN